MVSVCYVKQLMKRMLLYHQRFNSKAWLVWWLQAEYYCAYICCFYDSKWTQTRKLASNHVIYLNSSGSMKNKNLMLMACQQKTNLKQVQKNCVSQWWMDNFTTNFFASQLEILIFSLLLILQNEHTTCCV